MHDYNRQPSTFEYRNEELKQKRAVNKIAEMRLRFN